MSDLQKAMSILLKYSDKDISDPYRKDILTLCSISPDKVTSEDKEELFKLGFFVDTNTNQFSF